MLLYHTSSKRVFGVKKIRITIHECKRIASALTDFFYDHPDFCRARKREVSWVTLAPPSVWKVPGNDTTGRLDLFSSAGSHAWDNRDYHLISLEESICVCSSVSLQCWKPAIMCKRHSILTKSSSANCSTSRVENIPSLSLSNIWKICNQTEIGLILKHFQGYSLFMYLFLITEGTVKFVLYISVSFGSQCERGSHLYQIDYLIILLLYASVDIGRVWSRNGPYPWREVFQHKYLPKASWVSVQSYENIITRYFIPYINRLK